MSLLGKRRCKREATKCCYVKSTMLRHKQATGEGHTVKCVQYYRGQNQTQHLGECFCDTKKQKAGSYLALSYVPFVPLVPFQVLLIPPLHTLNGSERKSNLYMNERTGLKEKYASTWSFESLS